MTDQTSLHAGTALAAATELKEFAGQIFELDHEQYDVAHSHLEDMGDCEAKDAKEAEYNHMAETDEQFHATILLVAEEIEGHVSATQALDAMFA